MAYINKDVSTMAMPSGMNRMGQFPLDMSSVFYSESELRTYATSGAIAYVGQIVSLVDETNKKVTVYSIQNTDGLLKEVGTIPLGDNKTIEVSADGAIALLGAEGAANGTLPMLGDDGKLTWKTLEDIGAGDGNDNTTYEFSFANEKITIKPLFNGQPIKVKDDEGNDIDLTQELDLSAFVTKAELDEVVGAPAEGETAATGLHKVIADALAEAKKHADDNDANTEYHIEYDSDAKKIKLVAGKDDDKMAIDAAPFIKDGMLHDVKYDAASNTLTFTWNTDEGSKEDTVVLSDIIEPYAAGNGIDITAQAISAKVKAEDKYLTVDENGLQTKEIDNAIATAL